MWQPTEGQLRTIKKNIVLKKGNMNWSGLDQKYTTPLVSQAEV
jgi:hypothetical protein